MTTVSRTTTQGKDQEVLKGIEMELQSMQTLHLGGETYTPQTLAEFVQSRTDLANTVLTSKAAWEGALNAYDVVDRKVNVVLGDLRHLVMSAFGHDTSKLASFGFRPNKRPVLTSEQRSQAAYRALATRKARKTMGKKQKALVKGEAPMAPVSSPSEAT